MLVEGYVMANRILTVRATGLNESGKLWLKVAMAPSSEELMASLRKGVDLEGQSLHAFAHNIPQEAIAKLGKGDLLDCERVDVARMETSTYKKDGVDVLGITATVFLHGKISRTPAPDGDKVTIDW
jgi:hypothetical protein